MTTPSPQNVDVPAATKVAFVSLGCPKNTVDSEKMLGLLAGHGVIPCHDHDEADAIVINTCGFLEAAKQESLDVITEAVERKRRGGLKRVVVAGCLVQRHRARLLEWQPEIDAMLGVYDRDHILEAVLGPDPDSTARADVTADAPRYWIAKNALEAARERGRDTTGLTIRATEGNGIGYFESDAARLRLTPRHYAYLRISEGCNQNCSFCTIPSIRGKMRSKPLEAIASEARELITDGAFELNLIGQDTTSYGSDIGAAGAGGLPALLRTVNDALAPIEGWGRLMYAYPSCFTDEMIDTIAELPHIVKYIDIPLQHISDRILESMRRNTSRAQTEELLHKLRERVPGIAIRTTMITGFPGETDEEHDELVEFIESFGFDMLGVFKHSREQGTMSGKMELDDALRVPDEVKQARYDELMQAQQRVAFEQASYLAEQYAEGGLDQAVVLDVLIDGPSDAEIMADGDEAGGRTFVGRAYHQAPQVDSSTYVISRGMLAPGELVRCAIVGADGYDLIAQPLVDLDPSVSLPVLGS
jgi:ribosomal protein S12 methylthiotransferase